MPALGGAARKLVADLTGPIAVSPDGRQLAFLRWDEANEESVLLTARADGGGERRLAARKWPEFFGAPAWSPDGKVIACSALVFEAGERANEVVEVSVADGAQKVISARRWKQIRGLVWLGDGSGLLLAAYEGPANTPIWHLSYPEGRARMLTGDFTVYTNPSLSADSATLLARRGDWLTSIWAMAGAETGRARQVISGAKYYQLAWAPDGRILYTSNAGGDLDIWTASADGSGQRQLTTGAGSNLYDLRGAGVGPIRLARREVGRMFLRAG